MSVLLEFYSKKFSTINAKISFTFSPINLEWKVLYLEIKPNYFARIYSTMEQDNAITDRSDMRKKAFSFAIKICDCCRFILG